MESEEPSDKWVKAQRLQIAGAEARRMAFFGHRVMRAWEEGKRVINNTLNPIWKRVPGPIPSGVLPADVLYWVRRECWTCEAIERAKASTRQQHSLGSKTNPDAPKFQLQEHMESIEETAMERPFRESWFPKPWLVFVCFGLPSAR